MSLQTVEKDALAELDHAFKALRCLGWTVTLVNIPDEGAFVVRCVPPGIKRTIPTDGDRRDG